MTVISGKIVMHIDDKKLYEECVRQREEFLKWMAGLIDEAQANDEAAQRAGFSNAAETIRFGDDLLSELDADKSLTCGSDCYRVIVIKGERR